MRCSRRGSRASSSTHSAGDRLTSSAELDELTPREREVLQLIARGYMYKEIAARLHISVKTVESHVSSVRRKLQLSTRHELTRSGFAAPPHLGVPAGRGVRAAALRHGGSAVAYLARLTCAG